MGKSYNIDINTISMESWQKFVDNNYTIEEALNRCCSNIADMIANVNSINVTVQNINEEFSKLRKVHVGEAPDASEMLNQINQINEFMKEKSLIIISGINYAELAAEAFNSGTPVDQEATDLFTSLLKGASHINLFWLTNEVLKRNTGFSALGFCLAYGTDAQYEGGNFVVGDGAVSLFKLGMEKAFRIDKLPVWVNTTVGAAVVAGYVGVKDYIDNKGEKTNLDYRRWGLDALFSGLSFAEWSVVSGGVSSYVATSVTFGGWAGPAGVVAAGLITIPTAKLFDGVKDLATGDVIIHTYEDENGVTHEIPANGLGENGYFDEMVDILNDDLRTYTIGGQTVSESTYKDLLYGNWNELVKMDTGYTIDQLYGSSFNFDNVMEKVANIEDPGEAYEYYLDHTMGSDYTSYFLSMNYGFDAIEYIEHTHGIKWDEYMSAKG